MTAFGGVASDTTLTRSIHLAGDQFRKGATAPTDVTIGTTPTIQALRFDATNELASVYASLPADVDRSQDIILRLQVALIGAETNGETLDVTCNYVAVLENSTGDGPAKASTGATGQVTVTTANGLAAGDVYTMDITFAAGDATNPLANAIGLGIEINLTNVTGVIGMDLLDADLVYEALR
jgi:hypothetical protein